MTDNVSLASAYRLLAVGFQISAKQLSDTMEVKLDGSPAKLTAIPVYFLISHAAELLLKSALLKRGFSERDLKKYDYRHNLKSLLAGLQEKGISVTPETIWVIDGLHSQHQTHALRYSILVDNGEKTFWPPMPLLFAMLDELLMLTRISNQGV